MKIELKRKRKVKSHICNTESAFTDKSSEKLNLIIKSDVHGSSETTKNTVRQIKHDELGKNNII